MAAHSAEISLLKEAERFHGQQKDCGFKSHPSHFPTRAKRRLPPSLLDQARGLGIRPGPDSVRPKAWLPKPLSYRAGPGPNGLRVGYTAAHWPFFVGGDKNLGFIHNRGVKEGFR